MAERFACEVVSLETAYALAWDLAELVRAAGFRPELAVAVARGGFVPARLVCDFLGLHDLASVQVRHYGAGARKEAEARVVAPLSRNVSAARVLVVDDVNDTGDTLVAVRRLLDEADAAEVRTAVLHEKEGSRVRADFRARTLQDWRWLIYRWALVEDATGFLDRMDPPPRGVGEARAALRRDYDLELDPEDWKRIAALRGW